MALILKQIYGLLKLLNSDTGTNQIAAGVAAGFVLGMSPMLSLQSLLIFLCIFLFRIQAGAAFLSAFFFAFVAYVLDPLFHFVGSLILERPEFQESFTKMYNMPLVPFTRFNNSVVMGAGVIAIALFPITFWLARRLVVQYRVTVAERFRQSKLVKALKATTLAQWYSKYEQLYG